MMGWLRSIVREIYGLFVDDGSFAAAIAIWLGLVLLVLRLFEVPRRWCGMILFAGLVLLLTENILRYTRRPR